MIAEECERIFEMMSVAMRAAGLDWVITQVTEQIRFGKPETRRVQTTIDISPEVAVEGLGGIRKKARETFASTREYSTQEGLVLLIDALERAAVSTSEMEAVVRHELFGRSKGLKLIPLMRTDEPGREAFELEALPNAAEEASVQNLRQLVIRLREHI